MAKTFMQWASEAMAEVPTVSPADAYQRCQQDPNVLLIDVRDLADRRATGQAAGAIPISAGTLSLRADQELPAEVNLWREPRLQDRSRPVITICGSGPYSAIGAKTLKDMGFTDVTFVAGGTDGWKDAGLPTEQPSDA